ncbi:Ger(x)C family spore germination protein [Lysinibacillus telephonicus]|uniref:Ger(x)C family spore germination protein n=1 Tax=Lysinibacillus telephonicus TaxID=1714840 RepID=UPI0037D87402
MTKKYLLVILIPFLLAGCWDLDENERMYYVFGAGIDFKDGEYKATIQITSFANVAKTDQPNQDLFQSQVSSASGKTFDEALFKLYHGIDEKVYWGHFSFIIFSESALKQGRIDSVINTITGFSDTRYNIWLYCTDEPLDEFLLALPLLKKSITLTKIADPLNSFEQESYIEPLDIRNLIINLNEPAHEANIPYIKLKEDWKTQNEPLSSVEISGIGIITPNEFKGYIKDDQANGLQWISNKTIRGEITTIYEEDKYFSAVLRNVKVKIDPIINGNDVKFDINVRLTASLGSFEGNLTSDKIKNLIMKKVKKEIEQTYQTAIEMNVDVFKLSEILYRKEIKTWKKLQKDGQIELDEDSINIKINIEKLTSGRKNFRDTIE